MMKVKRTLRGEFTQDGAGVRLRRVFGYSERGLFDPFLLLDHFGSSDPSEYMAGFPWHPHRGIETVTYLLDGTVEHGDSMGNAGVIGPGDAQWMTAGSGVIHQEMPKPGKDGATMEGFQLWVNLPSELKMTSPRYRAVISGEVPVFEADGARIAVLAGQYKGIRGATPELFTDVRYLIVSLEPGAGLSLGVPAGHTAAAYVFRGEAELAGAAVGSGEIALFERPAADDEVGIRSSPGGEGARLLFISGKPLGEPIAWGGPIVMNTREELNRAFFDYEHGTFIKQDD